MGNSKYAQMLEKNIVKSSGIKEDDIYNYISLSSKSAGNAFKSFSKVSGKLSASTDTTTELTDQLVGSGFLDTEKFIGLPEGTSLTTRQNIQIKLGSVFAMLDNEDTRKILDTINSFAVTSKVANGSTKMASIGISEKNGHSGSADIYMNDSGILVTFPGISETKVFIPQSEIDAAKAKAESSNTAEGLSPEELKRLRKQITEIYMNAMDTADITYTKNVTWTKEISGRADTVNASVTGTDAAIVLSKDQTVSVVVAVYDLLANDEYLLGYAKDNFNLTEEQYKSLFNTDGIKQNSNVSVTIHHIVDVHNNVLASSIELSNESGGSLFISGTNSDKDQKGSVTEVSFRDKDGKSLDINVGCKKTTAVDGFAVFGIKSSIPKLEIDDLKFECSFTGAETKRFCGKDVNVGKYVITPSDPDKLFSAFENINTDPGQIVYDGNDDIVANTMSVTESSNLFGSDNAMLTELKKLTLTIESKLENSVMDVSFDISLGDIGSIGYYSNLEEKKEDIVMPDTAGALSINDETLGERLGQDAGKWLNDLIESIGLNNELINKIMGNIAGGVIPTPAGTSPYSAHYSAYDDMSEYNISSISYAISSALYTQITEMKDKQGVIKLYFKDGKPEIIDSAGVDGLADIDYTSGYLDVPMDSVYSEIVFNNNVEPTVFGVTSVYTDDPKDLPDALPNEINYYNYCYPWADDKNGYIGEFVVGTSPYLMTGEPSITELTTKADDLEMLNSFAKEIADVALDTFGVRNDISEYLNKPGLDYAIMLCYRTDNGTDWYEDNDSFFLNSDEVAKEFPDKLLKCLETASNTFGFDRPAKAAFSFNESKLLGVTVFENKYGALSFNDRALPSAGDISRSYFYNWYRDDDGEIQVGRVKVKYQDSVIPVGTYSIEKRGALGLPSAEPERKYDGVWNVTDINGQDISDGSLGYTSMRIVIDGFNCALETSSNENMYYHLIYGERYEGKPSAKLYYSSSNKFNGYIVFESETSGCIIEPDVMEDGTEYKTVINFVRGEGDGPSIIPSESVIDIRTISGVWRLESETGNTDLAISSDYVLSLYEENGYVSFDNCYYMNPSEDGFDIYQVENNQYIDCGRITYDSSKNTITYYEPQDGNPQELINVEKAPYFDYFGEWTVDLYEGISMEEYSETYDVEADKLYMNFDIGAYTVYMTDLESVSILTTKQPKQTNFKIAYDSSMFIDCTYDPQADTIKCVVKFDDDNEDGLSFTLKRGWHDFD